MSAAQQLLQQHLDRLRVPHAGVQAAAVAGVFDALARAPSLPGREHDAAVRQCLSSEHKVSALLWSPVGLAAVLETA